MFTVSTMLLRVKVVPPSADDGPNISSTHPFWKTASVSFIRPVAETVALAAFVLPLPPLTSTATFEPAVSAASVAVRLVGPVHWAVTTW